MLDHQRDVIVVGIDLRQHFPGRNVHYRETDHHDEIDDHVNPGVRIHDPGGHGRHYGTKQRGAVDEIRLVDGVVVQKEVTTRNEYQAGQGKGRSGDGHVLRMVFREDDERVR